ncbi:MAG: hypothetical protein VX498_07405, partial [Myxococcota bacterium]|nr:hypothetical protein [Myxococcota bacterium]
AMDRHTERLANGEGTCDSYDLYLDDVAAAYRPLSRPGVRLLAAQLEREEAVTWDDRTAPELGTYNQVGPAEAGRFSGQLLSYNGFVEQDLAHAYSCLGPDEVDETNYNQVMAEVDPDLIEAWELSAGELILNEGQNERWEVEVSGDLMGDESTVGSVEASFSAVRCEVPVTEDTLG